MPSSVISTMRYNAASRVLTIVYQGRRGTYRYFEVPPDEWIAFQAAESKGTYLNHTFKARDYRYERVTKTTK